jgi:hypothetical protein
VFDSGSAPARLEYSWRCTCHHSPVVNGAELDVVEAVSQHQFRGWWHRLDNQVACEIRHRTVVHIEVGMHFDFLRLPPRTSAVRMPDLSRAFSPELAVIVAARTSPRPLAICQVPGRDDMNWCHPRFFGITSLGRMLRVLMCEVLTERPAGLHGQPTLGTILRYTLMTPERTAQMITSWAALIPEGQRRSGPPTVTLVAHGGQNTLSKASMGVRPDHGRFIVTRMHREGTADLAMPLDEAQAISELASELKRMAL